MDLKFHFFLVLLFLLFFCRLKHAQAELKKKQSELKATEQGYKKDKDSYTAIQKNKDKLEVRNPVPSNTKY